ncbi:sensitivity to high expression protein she9, partial [Coemansia sp. RSA 2610]
MPVVAPGRFVASRLFHVGRRQLLSGSNGSHGIRRYAMDPGNHDSARKQRDKPDTTQAEHNREPVESVLERILEPGHAKSLGVSAAPASAGTSQRALVPLSIIYLPPPSWHRPLTPHAVKRPKADGTAAIDSMRTAGSQAPDADTSRPQTADDTHTDRAPAGRGLAARITRLFAPRSPADSTPSPHPALDQVEQKAADALSRLTAEKWQGSAAYRVLGTWRRTLASLRTLPRDDDWVTWAGKSLNSVTGYDRIAQLKLQVEASGEQFHTARRTLDETKSRHTRASKERLANQREINALLQRKHLWTEDDVARFTGLYRDEHQAEGAEAQAADELRDAELLVDRRYDQLVNAIRERYHEEQIWSDKIRRASTYGTWAVLFMNIATLLMAQAIFEPRKRRKIVAGVDERLAEALGEQNARIEGAGTRLELRLAEQEKVAAQMAQHLYNMSAAMDAVSLRQEAGMSGLGPQALGPAQQQQQQQAQMAVDPTLLLGEDRGYSDTELD